MPLTHVGFICYTRYQYVPEAHARPIGGSFGVYGPGSFVANITQESRSAALETLEALEVCLVLWNPIGLSIARGHVRSTFTVRLFYFMCPYCAWCAHAATVHIFNVSPPTDLDPSYRARL